MAASQNRTSRFFSQLKRKKKSKDESMEWSQVFHDDNKTDDISAFVHECMKSIKEEIKADVKKRQICKKSITIYRKLYDLYYEHRDRPEVRKLIGDQITQDEGGKTTTKYLKALTEDGKNTPTDGQKFESLTLLRSMCCNYTDASLDLCVELGRVGALPLLVADLKSFYKEFGNERIRENIIVHCITILHNCARAPENKPHFKEAAVLEAVVPYAKQDEDIEVKMTSILTLGYIIEEKDNDIISSDSEMIGAIIECLENAIQSHGRGYYEFAALELVSGLMHLASNDINKVIIVNEGILPILVKLMETGDEAEKALSAETVWVLSFRNKNKAKIREEEGMMDVLEKLQSQSSQATEYASGALWVLSYKTEWCCDNFLEEFSSSESEEDSDQELYDQKKQLHQQKTDIEDSRSLKKHASSVQKHIMISYQWGYQELAIQIKDRLKDLDYLVWIDVESMGGSTLEAMAKAIENSDTVLICTSQKYKDSPNCRTEAEYAYQRRKNIVPLLVEPKYQPDGWLGALQGTKLYFDFTDLENFDGNFSKLTKELGNRGKAISMDDIDSPSGFAMTKSASRDAVKGWSNDRVKQWASSNEIASEQIRSLDGKKLAFLHKFRKKAPESFFRHLKDELKLSDTNDLTNLDEALDTLYL